MVLNLVPLSLDQRTFKDTLATPLKSVVRKAEKDLKQIRKNKEREEKAFDICLEKIEKHTNYRID